MSEFTPPGQGARMTAAQIRKYQRELKRKRAIAQAKLDEARKNGELETPIEELEALERMLDDPEIT